MTGVRFYDQDPTSDPFTFFYLYNYNGAGRVTGNRMQVYNSGSVKLVDMQGSYALDNLGNMTSMTYPIAPTPGNAPSGPTFNCTYDAMHRLSGLNETYWSNNNNTAPWFQSSPLALSTPQITTPRDN